MLKSKAGALCHHVRKGDGRGGPMSSMEAECGPFSRGGCCSSCGRTPEPRWLITADGRVQFSSSGSIPGRCRSYSWSASSILVVAGEGQSAQTSVTFTTPPTTQNHKNVFKRVPESDKTTEIREDGDAALRLRSGLKRVMTSYLPPTAGRQSCWWVCTSTFCYKRHHSTIFVQLLYAQIKADQ